MILGSILNVCKDGGSSKTRIVYQVNLNFKNAGNYLDWLIKRDYLVKEKKIFRITPKGQELLNNLDYVNSIINENIDE